VLAVIDKHYVPCKGAIIMKKVLQMFVMVITGVYAFNQSSSKTDIAVWQQSVVALAAVRGWLHPVQVVVNYKQTTE